MAQRKGIRSVSMLLLCIFMVGFVACGKEDKVNIATALGQLSPDSSVALAVNQYYPGYVILRLADLTEDLQMYFKDTYGNAPPGCVQADFDDDGFADYALLLLVKTERAMGRIAVLQGKGNGAFVPMSDGTVRNSYYHGNCYITSVPPGKITEWDNSRTAVLRNPGFKFINWESSACVFFWQVGKFDCIWTED